MKTLEQLYNGFYLNEMCENTRISNGKTPLRVSPIKKVNKYESLEIDNEHFAFAEKDEKGEIEYFHGLKNFLRIEKSDFPPVFIFDNHNHAPVFRHYVMKQQNKAAPILIHIDQHSDCWENKEKLEIDRDEYELEKVFHFCNEKCNVGNFIPPAIESGMIVNQVQIRSTTALQNLKIDKNQNFILDIDLDFCLDGIDRDKVNRETVNLLKKKFDEIGKSALCITIATSPYFINQELTIEIIKKIFNNKFEYYP